MSSPVVPASASAFKDRSGWITFFGVAQMVLGALTLGMALLAVLGTLLLRRTAGPPQLNLRMAAMTPVFYILLAAFFIVMGIGAVKVRRWARALMLVVSILWLIMGVVTVPMMAVTLPKMLATQAENAPQAMPQGLLFFMSVLVIAFMTVIYVLIPLVFTMFYGSRSVKATFERRDPVARWTDQTPLPVLALFVMLTTGALSCLVTGLLMPVIPFFGSYLTGPAGSVVCVGLAVLWAWLAWSNFRLQSAGWWATIAAVAVASSSFLITFAGRGILDLYRQMGMSESELQRLSNMSWIHGPFMLTVGAISSAVFIVYMLFIRRYYGQKEALINSDQH